MAPWEALRAFTVGSARVLGQESRLGRLAAGFAADFGLYATGDHRHLASHWGVNHAAQVFKKGKRLLQSPPIRC
jgi:imidazolonepropionase-like amidohydrolase